MVLFFTCLLILSRICDKEPYSVIWAQPNMLTFASINPCSYFLFLSVESFGLWNIDKHQTVVLLELSVFTDLAAWFYL